jgi:uncharacterized protein
MRGFLMALAALACATSASAEPTFPERGTAAVVDTAHVLPADERAALDRKIADWVDATGHQLVVVTVPDLQGTDIKDYGYQLGRSWGIGDEQRNDGVILLLAIKERKVRIEVGYGLEPILTDAITRLILDRTVVPRLREGDMSAALNDGADDIMRTAAIGSEETPASHDEKPLVATGVQNLDSTTLGWIMFGAVTIILAIIALIDMALQDRRRTREAEGLTIYPTTSRDRITRYRPGAAPATTPPPEPDPAEHHTGYQPHRPSRTHFSTPSPARRDAPASSGGSSSSNSGFASGGGSFGGGGSDSSW